MMTTIFLGKGLVYIIFILVYLGMIVGRFPTLALDRTGIVLLGTIILLIASPFPTEILFQAVDTSTIMLLFGFMIISAQLRLGGFYTIITQRAANLDGSPQKLLAVVIIVSGALSALLSNDIICLAMTPVLGEVCIKKGLNPLPFLLSLACAANIGSALTLIGNPQNMLIGQSLLLPFGPYMLFALIPVVVSLFVLWSIVCFLYRQHWHETLPLPQKVDLPFLGWQTAKGIFVLSVVVVLFLFAPLPRDLVALGAAAILLTSRTMASRKALNLVDWQLIVLFIGLFIINGAFAKSGGLAAIEKGLHMAGISLQHGSWLFWISAILSNVVSNVPAVMLLLPLSKIPLAGPILALSSTFAGNLIVVGSIANIIVINGARDLGLAISWRDHARIGIPVTLTSLLISWIWIFAGGPLW
ncbi:SLC13 family permease [Aminobacterium sp. EBM-42]|uniref:SLC13 family permease n=1 Tax=Aminobacterium sp. EBM-42 TaxID=1918503 RepID=UPI00257BB9CF|nr:SLC13 family permease [Aminobacterium sp. EBM-42]